MSSAANTLRSITRSSAIAKALSPSTVAVRPVARFSGSAGLRSGKEDELRMLAPLRLLELLVYMNFLV